MDLNPQLSVKKAEILQCGNGVILRPGSYIVLTMLNTQFPSTRYQGSKQKLISWLGRAFEDYAFDTVLDAYGGTGSVSYLFKKMHKSVTYNDYLKWNCIQARGLIENNGERLEPHELDALFLQAREPRPGKISKLFQGVYFTDSENAWLDTFLPLLAEIQNPYKQSLVFFALFQAALAKRPYNLFHRRNLYIRTAEVQRSFGNKKTWDTPFEDHMRRYINEANNAVFEGAKPCQVQNSEVLGIDGTFDFVYLDPPYTSAGGISVDYHGFYHFLEGMTQYESWETRIDYGSRHKRLQPRLNGINDKRHVSRSILEVFDRFRGSTLAFSYRADGVPTVPEIEKMMLQFKKEVRIFTSPGYQYALSPKKCDEVLIVGR